MLLEIHNFQLWLQTETQTCGVVLVQFHQCIASLFTFTEDFLRYCYKLSVNIETIRWFLILYAMPRIVDKHLFNVILFIYKPCILHSVSPNIAGSKQQETVSLLTIASTSFSVMLQAVLRLMGFLAPFSVHFSSASAPCTHPHNHNTMDPIIFRTSKKFLRWSS